MQDLVLKKPAPMLRKQFFITADQNRRLKVLAAARGVSEADLVRAGIEQVLNEADAPSEDWRERLRRVQQTIRLDDDFAARVRENKEEQRKLWQARMARNRRQLDGK